MLSKNKRQYNLQGRSQTLGKKTKDLGLNHIISHSSYNNDFHADFLAKSFVKKRVVFSV